MPLKGIFAGSIPNPRSNSPLLKRKLHVVRPNVPENHLSWISPIPSLDPLGPEFWKILCPESKTPDPEGPKNEP